MAVSRCIALKVDAGMGRCWTYDLAWDEDGSLDDARVIAWCDQPPVATVQGSGVCEDHAPLFIVGRGIGGWANN